MRRYVFVLVLTFLTLAVFKTAYAQEEPVELVVPQYFADGTRCPDADNPADLEILEEQGLDWGYGNFDPRDHIFLCGSIKNVQKRYENGQTLIGNPIEGVVVAVYQSAEGGKLDFPYFYNVSNGQGEFMVAVKRNVTNYIAFMCPIPGSNSMLLTDLYEANTAIAPHSYNTFDIGLPCPSTPAQSSIVLPTQVGFLDDEGFLECGVGEAPYTPAPNARQTISDVFNLVLNNVDNSYAGNVVDIDDPDPGSVPADATVPSGVALKGYHKGVAAEDSRAGSANLNLLQPDVTSNRSSMYGEGGEGLPTCDQIKQGYEIVSSGSKSSRETWGLLGLSFPGQLKQIFDSLSSQVKNNYKVCYTGSTVKTLADFEWGDPGFPYGSLVRIANDVNLDEDYLYSEYDYHPSADNGVNLPTDNEASRDTEITEQTVANKPFYATAHARATKADGIVANVVGELGSTGFTPLELLRFPGQTDVAQINASADEGFSGLTRVGIGTELCSCSSIDGAACSTPTNDEAIDSPSTLPGYLLDNSGSCSFFGQPCEGAVSTLFQLIYSVFSWFTSTLEETIGECLDYNDYEVVPYCEPSNASCEPVRTCNDVYCTVEYRHYNFKVQAGECNGDITAQVPVEIKNDPPKGTSSVDDKTLAWAKLIYKLPGASVADIGGAGMWKNAVSDSVEGEKTKLGESSQASKQAGLYNTDLLRMSVSLPFAKVQADYNPPKVYASSVPVTGQCDGKAFGKILKNGWSNPTYQIAMSPLDQFNQFSGILGNIGTVQYEAYGAAEAATGVPCEILAGIHWVEGSNGVSSSLLDGGPLRGATLAEDAIVAANHFKSLSMGAVPGAGSDPTAWTIDQVMWGLSAYNGGGNQQCYWVAPNNYVSPPTAVPLSSYGGCPQKFVGEDDLYVTHLLSSKYVNMAIIYPQDGMRSDVFCANNPSYQTCPVPYESDRPGAFTIAFLVHGGFVQP